MGFPFTSHCRIVRGTPRGTCSADSPSMPMPVVTLCQWRLHPPATWTERTTTLTWTPQLSISQHQIHLWGRERQPASLPGCTGHLEWNQTKHQHLLQTHPYWPLHPLPHTPPSKNHHWSAQMYVWQGPPHLWPWIQTVWTPTSWRHLHM